ncbi:MAG: hypothetical protein LCI03_19980 [Actinobacteria bacterium]|nr:hypothetical protein [Actinomycetota bacterium]
MSDFFQKGSNETLVEWTSLRNGLMLTPSVAALGGFAFLVAAIFIVQDRREAHVAMKGDSKRNLLKTQRFYFR